MPHFRGKPDEICLSWKKWDILSQLSESNIFAAAELLSSPFFGMAAQYAAWAAPS